MMIDAHVLLLPVCLYLLCVSIAGQQSDCPAGYTASRDGRYCWQFIASKYTHTVASDVCVDLARAAGREVQYATLADVHSPEYNQQLGNLIFSAHANDPELRYESAWETWLGGVEDIHVYPTWEWVESKCTECGDGAGTYNTSAPADAQGCYRYDEYDDDDHLRPMSRYIDLSRLQVIDGSGSSNNIIELCKQQCTRRGYQVAAVRRLSGSTPRQYRDYAPQGTLCMCGRISNSRHYASEGLSDEACRERCGRNGPNRCGGTDSNYVYLLSEHARYTPWAIGQPNAFNRFQRCGASKTSMDGEIGDENCFKTNQMSTVCEIPPWQCSNDWADGEYHMVANKCLFFSTENGLNWFQARINCWAKQGDLVILSNATLFEEYQSALEMFTSRDTERAHRDYWVGLTSSQWRWTNHYNPVMNYVNWQSSEASEYEAGQSCMMMVARNNNYGWHSADCGDLKTSVCQLDLEPYIRHTLYTTLSPTLPVTTRPDMQRTQPVTSSSSSTSSPSSTSTTAPSSSSPSPTVTPSPTSHSPRTQPSSRSTGKPNNDVDPGGARSDSTTQAGDGGGEPDAGASKDQQTTSSDLETFEIVMIVVAIVLLILVIAIAIGVYCFRKRDTIHKVGSTYDARPSASVPDETIYVAHSESGSQSHLIADSPIYTSRSTPYPAADRISIN